MHDEEAWFRGYFPNVTQKEPAVAGLLVVSLNATWS
jgi:hypothetical protein